MSDNPTDAARNGPTLPAGFDPNGPSFVIVGEFPVFEMPRAWVGPRLSLAAVGLLARVQAAGDGPFEMHDFTGGDRDLAASIEIELRTLDILRGDQLVDPTYRPPLASVATDAKPYAPDPGTVYYLLRADGAVKIGHTSNLHNRMRGLVRSWGPLVELATERASVLVEDERHQQFRALRMPDQGPNGGTEFFHAGPTLVRHIETLRAAAAVAVAA